MPARSVHRPFSFVSLWIILAMSLPTSSSPMQARALPTSTTLTVDVPPNAVRLDSAATLANPPSAGDFIAYYPFNGNANDESGNGNHGTINGATTTEDRFGNLNSAYRFDGIDDYIRLPSVTNGIPEGTVGLWFKASSWNPGSAGLYLWAEVKYPPGSGSYFDGINLGIHPYYSGNKQLLFGIYELCHDCWRWALSGTTPDLEEWYHVAGTWGPKGVRIYVNGVLKGTNPYTGHAPTYTTLGMIGASSWPGTFVDGVIDDVRIYNRALTEEEIRTLYSDGHFFISGQVTDGSENGISGVTLSAGAASSTTTDDNGTYTISRLSAGTYTLTPTKPSYTFSPASRTVTVPPDATGQDFTAAVALQSPLTLNLLYPATTDQPSRIQRGGVAHRYFEVRDAAGALAPLVTVSFTPTGSGTSDGNGFLDVAVNADDLSIQASHLLTDINASRWGQTYALAESVSFVVETSERPFEHHWYGGTVYKAKGGISAGLVAYLAGQIKGGLGWSLTETDPDDDTDDDLRLREQFQAEVGGGIGVGAELKIKPLAKVLDAGATASTELRGLSLVEWQFDFRPSSTPPYSEAAQRAQAALVLAGLMDMAPKAPGWPMLAAILTRAMRDANYAAYGEQIAGGMGVEWTRDHLHAGAEIKIDFGEDERPLKVAAASQPDVLPIDVQARSPISLTLLDLDALDTEKTLRLFGTLTDHQKNNEWGVSLEQESGFDLNLLTVQTPVTPKIGLYMDKHSTKLKEELFYDKATMKPVRFELSITGEGNPVTFHDLTTQSVTIKFIAEGADLQLALDRVHNLTALLAAWDIVQRQGLIVGTSAALREVNSYLNSVPLARYEITAITDDGVTAVPPLGFTAGLDIELGAGVELQAGRELVIERGYIALTGMHPTEVYPDRQYGSRSGKNIWGLIGNAMAGARLIVGDALNSIAQAVQAGANWTVDILSRTADGIVRGGARLFGGSGMTYRQITLAGAPLETTEAITVTATSWVPETTGVTSNRLRLASGAGFTVGGVYQFQPYTLTLTPPATLAITYTVEATGTANPALFALYRWRPEDQNWQPLSATHDTANRVMTTTINQLGTFTIGYDTTPPAITVLQPGNVVTNTHFPQLEALVADTGSGVEPLSVQASLSGVPVTATYASLTGRLWYTGTAFLPNGSYTYTLSARDTSGNPVVYGSVFTVAVPAPAVLGVEPPVLPRGVTTTVTITGQNFAYPPLVQVDGKLVADTGYQGLAAITLTAPITLTNGPHNVAVAAPDGQVGAKSAAFEVVEPSALEPQAPALSLNRLSNGVRLSWQRVTTSTQGYAVPVDQYKVYRSANPYAAPDGMGSVKLADVPTSASGSDVNYTDTQAFGLPLTDYFYVVVAINRWGQASSISSRVGAFNFALTPGAP